MRWTSMLAIYVLFWAFSVFLVLPFGVRTAEEAGAERIPGQAESAPHEFRVGRTALRVEDDAVLLIDGQEPGAPARFHPLRILIQITIVATIAFGLFYVAYINGWTNPDVLSGRA